MGLHSLGLSSAMVGFGPGSIPQPQAPPGTHVKTFLSTSSEEPCSQTEVTAWRGVECQVFVTLSFLLAVELKTCKPYTLFHGLLLLWKPRCWVCVMGPGPMAAGCAPGEDILLVEQLFSSTTKGNRENYWQNQCLVLPPSLVLLRWSLSRSPAPPVLQHEQVAVECRSAST